MLLDHHDDHVFALGGTWGPGKLAGSVGKHFVYYEVNETRQGTVVSTYMHLRIQYPLSRSNII